MDIICSVLSTLHLLDIRLQISCGFVVLASEVVVYYVASIPAVLTHAFTELVGNSLHSALSSLLMVGMGCNLSVDNVQRWLKVITTPD